MGDEEFREGKRRPLLGFLSARGIIPSFAPQKQSVPYFPVARCPRTACRDDENRALCLEHLGTVPGEGVGVPASAAFLQRSRYSLAGSHPRADPP